MDGQWLKITRNLFDSSCDTINNKILKSITQTNLTDFKVHCRSIFVLFSCTISLVYTAVVDHLALQQYAPQVKSATRERLGQQCVCIDAYP